MNVNKIIVTYNQCYKETIAESETKRKAGGDMPGKGGWERFLRGVEAGAMRRSLLRQEQEGPEGRGSEAGRSRHAWGTPVGDWGCAW